MQNYLIFITLASVHFVSLVSPGPDFLLITRISILESRKRGLLAAVGVTFANIVHVLYSLVVVYFVGYRSDALLVALQFVGGAYLFVIGLKALIKKEEHTCADSGAIVVKKDYGSFALGFFSSILNAKAAMYFLSVIPQFINMRNSNFMNILIILEIIFISLFWFCTVAVIASSSKLKNWLNEHLRLIDKGSGLVFILFSFLIFFSLLSNKL